MMKYQCIACGEKYPCICCDWGVNSIPFKCPHDNVSRVEWKLCKEESPVKEVYDFETGEVSEDVVPASLTRAEESIVGNIKYNLTVAQSKRKEFDDLFLYIQKSLNDFETAIINSRKSNPPSCTCQTKNTDVPNMGLIYFKRDCPVHGKLRVM